MAPCSAAYAAASSRCAPVNVRQCGRTISVRSASSAFPRGCWRTAGIDGSDTDQTVLIAGDTRSPASTRVYWCTHVCTPIDTSVDNFPIEMPGKCRTSGASCACGGCGPGWCRTTRNIGKGVPLEGAGPLSLCSPTRERHAVRQDRRCRWCAIGWIHTTHMFEPHRNQEGHPMSTKLLHTAPMIPSVRDAMG